MSNINKQALREAANSVIQKYGSEWFEKGREIFTVRKTKIEFISSATPTTVLALLDELEAKDRRIAELQAMLARLYAECDTGERRGNGSQSGVSMPSWGTVEAVRLLLGVK